MKMEVHLEIERLVSAVRLQYLRVRIELTKFFKFLLLAFGVFSCIIPG
jgi:hypothetical protein